MANIMENENEANLRRDLVIIQSMIDISADRLEGLRTQCECTQELTQQEIRTLETKLVKMFSELLIIKAKLPENLPKMPENGLEIRQWLRVVGLSGESLNAVIHRVNSLEALMDKNDNELRAILTDNSQIRDEEISRLIRAMNCLKICQHGLKKGTKEQTDLYWDSWDKSIGQLKPGTSPRTERSKAIHKINRHQQHPLAINNYSQVNQNAHQQNVQVEQVQSPMELSPPEHQPPSCNNINAMSSPDDVSFHTLTPSPSPPNSPASTKTRIKGFPTTPPPRKKHQTLVSANSILGTLPTHSNNNTVVQPTTTTTINGSQISSYDQQSLTKSRSHEFQLLKQQEQMRNQQENLHPQLTNSNSHQPSTTSPHYCCTTITANGVQQQLNSGINHIAPIISATTSESNINVNHVTTTHAIPTPRSRLHTEPGPDTDTSDNISTMNLSVPRSPCTPIARGMGHMIQHRFTKNFRMTNSTCDLCNKQVFFGLKCTECKYRCHKDCKPNVPPSCGLPQEFVDEFKKTLQNDGLISNTSPSLSGRSLLPSNRRNKSRIPTHSIHGPDSSSAGSSCNSSSPSSPALLVSLHPQTPAASNRSQFNFPEVSSGSNTTINGGYSDSSQEKISTNIFANERINNVEEKTKIEQFSHSINSESSTSTITAHKQNLSDLADTHRSNDSDKTVSLTGSASTSTDSERTPVRLDSMEERDSINWPRQNSLSLKEWDIPYDDLRLLEKIGKGRFGTVHRALWHGDVAVKLLKEDYLDDDSTLEAFKLEVATFKKTRHENLVLFMGACMKPPRLAIVTSLCKGNTLYTHIHLRKDKFNLNRTTLVAQQISQGMGYLHARDIVHKDLKTKNIFLENGKVIITDFGLFSATKLSYTEHGLGIARGWLCYLAPELIKGLKPYRPTDEDLPFTKWSDVYAFGTVWYELLCGEFPFKSQPHESVIWQVGRGMKQTLANLQASRDIKDILMMCWGYDQVSRPDFAKLLQLLERLPKKRLARSPSHPVQLSRSAESVF